MSKIFATQTDLTIKLTTGKNLTGMTDFKIKYKTPTGVFGEWMATLDTALSGIIKYDIIAPLTIVGNWTLWAKVTDTQGLISIGEPSTMIVYKEGL